MLKLNYQHSLVNLAEAKEKLEKIKNLSLPDFVKFKTDIEEIEKDTKRYQHYSNIIVIGNGGAINSFHGFYSSLAMGKSRKKAEILNTIEPDNLNLLKSLYSRDDTLVVFVSKSGTNPTALQAMFAFWDYPKVIICTEGEGTLHKIVKREGLHYFTYPCSKEFSNLDDRHTGISASGLVPAALLGINIKEIYAGAKEMYEKCAPAVPVEENPALRLAASLYLLEKRGFIEIFCPIYSTRLHGFLPALIQTFHETVCKEGQGQTVFGDLAPESHHHTNQRLFGGKKNVLALFITAQQDDRTSMLEIPAGLTDIQLREGILHDINVLPYFRLLEFDFRGTFQDAVEKNIPAVHLELAEVSPKSVGQFLALIQYVGVYSAHLRGVDPLGQPQVERSKQISFELARNYRY